MKKAGLPTFIKQLDMYGLPMPGFNIEGEQVMTTNTGGVVSVMIIYVTLLFAILKFVNMLNKENPTVFSYFEPDAVDVDYMFNMIDEDFMIAFSLEDYNTGETKMNTDYVKFYAMYSDMKDGKRGTTEVPLHKCTEEDYSRFYPVEQRSSSLLNKYKTKDNMQLFCLDLDKLYDLPLFGTQAVKTFGSLQFMAVPCNMRLTHIGGLSERISPTCVDDLEKQIEYLGSMNFVTYYNKQELTIQEFSPEKKISRTSAIKQVQADQYRPSWIEASVQKDMLQDEIQVFQLGNQEETEYV